MLDEILNYISSVDKDLIRSVYLARKTVTDEIFTSAFVIRFVDDASDEDKYDIIHKIYRHLDTSSDRQFSLFEYNDERGAMLAQINCSLVFDSEKTADERAWRKFAFYPDMKYNH